MRRRQFIAGLGAAAWPVVARGQQDRDPVNIFLAQRLKQLADFAIRRGVAAIGPPTSGAFVAAGGLVSYGAAQSNDRSITARPLSGAIQGESADGNNIETCLASYHAPYDHCTAKWLAQAGVQNTFVRLADHGIRGNGHMMMLEKNNLEISALLRRWEQDNVK